jgi:hypothetical protein
MKFRTVFSGLKKSLRTMCRFHRAFSDGGAFPVDLNGINRMLWSFGADSSPFPSYHRSRCVSFNKKNVLLLIQRLGDQPTLLPSGRMIPKKGGLNIVLKPPNPLRPVITSCLLLELMKLEAEELFENPLFDSRNDLSRDARVVDINISASSIHCSVDAPALLSATRCLKRQQPSTDYVPGTTPRHP